MTETPDNASVGVIVERSDAARNRARLLEAAALLVATTTCSPMPCSPS